MGARHINGAGVDTARRVALSLSVLVAALGASVLAGWALDLAWLKSAQLGSATMKPNTATAFLLDGVALVLLSRRNVGQGARRLAALAGCVGAALGALTLGEAFFGWDLGIDQWLFREPPGAVETTSPGQMSPPAAFCFLLTGIVLLLALRPIGMRLRVPVVSALSVSVIVVGGLALLGHLSFAWLDIRLWNYAGLAMHTAVGLLLLGCALLAWVRSGHYLTWAMDAMTTGAFVVGIVSIVAAAGISYSFTDQLRRDASRVTDTQEVLKETQELMGSQKDLTISLGRYLITGDETSLAARARIKAAVQEDIEDVRRLTADDPRQRTRLNQVEQLTRQRVALSDQIIAANRQQGDRPAAGRRESPLGGDYPRLGEAIDRVLADMVAEEYTLLGPRQALSNASSTRTFLLMPVGVYVSLTMLLLGMFTLNSETIERRHIEVARARLAAIVESSEDAIIGKDTNGIITNWNGGAAKVFGYPAEEMVGRSIAPLLPSDRLDEEDHILARMRRGETVEHLETVRKRKDGRLIDVSITVSPIKDAAGNVIGASKIARDISEQKALEQQLRQSQKMEAVGQLTGGIAHDFNNLLGVVLGNLDLLEGLVAGNDAAIQRVKNAQKAALRGADLTRRMLVFSSRQSLKPAPTSLSESIQNIIEMAARALGPDIEITTNLDKSIPPVLVDAAGLENVLLNLAVNARDAMPGGGSLMISTSVGTLAEGYLPVQAEELKAGRYARVTVSDTGTGMSRETLERAFEPFFTTKPRGKGTGLGLAMVYGFARQSGGTVRIYSELGHGTTVTLFLPLADAMPVAAPAPVVASILRAGAGRTVLVVDDEVDLLEIAVAYLEEMGYRALQATDGANALEVVAREPGIELLVTDVIMPGGMNGVELARRVRQLKPDVKIIYSSGFPSNTLAERSGTEVDGPLLNKPYQRSEFEAAIDHAMAGAP